jgi:hypothetical protein
VLINQNKKSRFARLIRSKICDRLASSGSKKAACKARGRSFLKIEGWIYNLLATIADECSLDISSLIFLIGCGYYRLRDCPRPQLDGHKAQTVRLSAKQVHELIAVTQAERGDCDPTLFAIQVVLGAEKLAPNAPVLFTISERRVLEAVNNAQNHFELSPVVQQISSEFQAAVAGFRARYEITGFQPEDLVRVGQLKTLTQKLRLELMLQIDPGEIEALWRDTMRLIGDIGKPERKKEGG